MFAALYKITTFIAWPFIAALLAKRKIMGKEDLSRFNERLGIAYKPRPSGKLIWFHGASVGEAVSMLELIKLILDKYQDVSILVTTGTVTSAELMTNRLPERAFHQYVPVDCFRYVDRFLKHWQPNGAFFFESEFWPNLIFATAKTKIPMVLINGRVSDRTFKKWQRLKPIIAAMLKCFDLCLGQTDEDARRLNVLGALKTANLGNIKYSAPKLPVDNQNLEKLKKLTENRTLWLSASTHNGEEKIAGLIHKNLKKQFSNLLTVIVPRHPKRKDEIIKQLRELDLSISCRSDNDKITDKTDVYLADTIGELGLMFSLCPIVFVGGSLIPHGGQNFLEPSRFSCAVIVGNHTHNFTEMVKRAKENSAIIEVANEAELEQQITTLINNPELIDSSGKKALAFAESEAFAVNRIMTEIETFIEKA